MSAVFDTMQEEILELVGDPTAKRYLRMMIDRLEEISHQSEDFLNKDERLRRLASKLIANRWALRGEA